MIGVSAMQKYICILAALGCLLCAGSVEAKVYWLPDYLQENLDRVNEMAPGEEGGSQTRSCPAGWLTAAESAGLICSNKTSIPGVGLCYSGCTDPCDGLVDNNCGNFECQKYYAGCSSKCEVCYQDNCHNREDKIINPEWGCQQYWEDCSSKCEIPYEDGCFVREDNLINTEWGCQQYWEDCDTKCEIPYEDNCRNRPDNETDYGCQKDWADCASKCEVGKTCVPTDCSEYPLSSPPANASYEECSNSCEPGSSKKYRFVSCNAGYYDSQKFICENKQLCTWAPK